MLIKYPIERAYQYYYDSYHDNAESQDMIIAQFLSKHYGLVKSNSSKF